MTCYTELCVLIIALNVVINRAANLLLLATTSPRYMTLLLSLLLLPDPGVIQVRTGTNSSIRSCQRGNNDIRNIWPPRSFRLPPPQPQLPPTEAEAGKVAGAALTGAVSIGAVRHHVHTHDHNHSHNYHRRHQAPLLSPAPPPIVFCRSIHSIPVATNRHY